MVKRINPLAELFFACIMPRMFRPEPPTQRQLISIGISQSHASQLLAGLKSPSLEKAKQIQAVFGFPVDAWPMPKKGVSA